MSSLLDSVYALLLEANKPMNSKELTAFLLERGLWTTMGKTPDATVGARIYSNIKKEGRRSRFIKTGKGVFSLNPEAKPVSVKKKGKKVSGRKSPPIVSPSYSFTDSAEQVLLHFSSNAPMHYRDITDKALEMGWLKSEGLTPEATMRARIADDIQRRERQGKKPRFERFENGMIGLAAWTTSGLERQIDDYNNKQRKLLRDKVKDLTPFDFEKLITRLLVAMGFEEVGQTKYSGDGGVDARGVLVVHEVMRIRLAVQAKRWKSNVQSPVIQQLRGSLGTDERGLIVTTSSFSKGAVAESKRTSSHTPIDLIDGEQLVSLLIEYNIGVRKNRYQLLEMADSFFDEE